MTVAGFVMGAISCGLWVAPAAWFAFRGGYMTHGWVYTITVIAIMVLVSRAAE